ncbi:MAG: aldehyde dehydrogenase (NADP(+)) [Spirosoma sp.]|nr:aldehyde dehydrogenase (NADP(+)) [Spirosoma sp.]
MQLIHHTLSANFIGQEATIGNGDVFYAHAPAHNETLPNEFANVTTEQASLAVARATAAFGPYSSVTPQQRADFLEAIAQEIENLGDALIERAVLESGLPTGRITGERGRTTGQLRLFARLLREGSWVDARINPAPAGVPGPDRQPLPRPDLRRMLVPLGPVVVFGASNFPLAFSVAGGDTASALAAGCPVVCKAHPAHPGTSSLVGSAIIKAAQKTGIPDGVFSLLHADNDVAQGLVADPAIKAVGFTGSRRGGLALLRVAQQRTEPIPVFAEMSAVNPVVILPGAIAGDATTVAAGLAASVTLGVGQFCTNPGLIFLMQSPQTDVFLDTLAEKIRISAPATMLSTGIKRAYQDGIQHIQVMPGIHILAEADADAADNRTEGRPTILTTTAPQFLSNSELSHEIFGPSSLVVICRTEAELADCINSLEGQLTATLYATTHELAQSETNWIALLQEKAGRLLFGGLPTGVEVSEAMMHGGPFPATTDSRSTSVGTGAILRWVRPVSYQSFPDSLLPPALQDANPLGIWRNIDGEMTR